MDPFERLAPALRWMRTQQGRRQRDIAHDAGLTRAMLSAYETGRKQPSLATLGRLLVALGADLRDLHVALALQGGTRLGDLEERERRADAPPAAVEPS